ncbi:cytochrome c-type biogenesis protein CcmH [Cytobacillus eiseniae]|uniref:Cytochrome c-type biogenesis protein n=1 Tax=Cytobacillus eiseniae TaxID=762947 RepID=A0ABS4RF06_9BACI|nr:cytochrome c-type biogenesis protein CcmH [Cytobacillus eiseniae]MBP2241497.1 cytochrome c-type biogenesis protein CcmH [Cytobacillus eiseniae]
MKELSRRQMIKCSLAAIASIILIDLSMNDNSVKANGKYDYNSKEFKSIINQLDMQGHADHDYSTCSIKKVYYEEVIEALNQGKSEKEILQSYVDEYGQAALRTPATEGSGLIAWIAPAFGFLLGAIIVGYGIKRLTKKKDCTDDHLDAEEMNVSETEKEIIEQTFEEERKKYF